MAKRLWALATMVAATLLSGCISVPPEYGQGAGDCTAQTGDPGVARNPIYFVATGRPDCDAGKPLALSVRRGTFRPYGTALPDPVLYGVATVGSGTLPTLGLAPAAAWHARVRRDMVTGLSGKVATARRVLVYVHGYNDTPAEALSSADQVALAGRFDGPVVAFLWPSQHALTKYSFDEENALWTEAYFASVLADLAGQADEVVLVAHSMGNRIAIEGLRQLQASAPALAGRVRTVVLAAPDVDRELFDRDIAPEIVRPGRRVILFASGNDLALRGSWAVHGHPRAGDLGCVFSIGGGAKENGQRCYPAPRGAPGQLTVVDGTGLKARPFGHSVHIDTPEGRAVLRQIFAGTEPAGVVNGVLLMHPGAGACDPAVGRLGLAFAVVGCGGR